VRVCRSPLAEPPGAGSAVSRAHGHQGLTPLHVAASYDHHLACLLLIAHGADVNLPDRALHRTALHWACAVSAVSATTAESLLKVGADVTLSDTYGAQPLHLAASLHKWDAVVVLLRAGAPVTQPDNGGNTVFVLAQLPLSYKTTWLRERLGGAKDIFRSRRSFVRRPREADGAVSLLLTRREHAAASWALRAPMQAAKRRIRFFIPFVALPAFLAVWCYLSIGYACLAGLGVAVATTWTFEFHMPTPRMEPFVGVFSGVYLASYMVVVATHLLNAPLREGTDAARAMDQPRTCVTAAKFRGTFVDPLPAMLERHPLLHAMFVVLACAMPFLIARVRNADPGYYPKAASRADEHAVRRRRVQRMHRARTMPTACLLTMPCFFSG